MTASVFPAATAVAPAKAGERLVSLDIYRGLVIVVMTLVNYLSPVQGVPAWSKHWPESMEGYTYVDVVFPAFLFIVGVAIPFALQRRLSRGDSPWALGGKIFLRSLVLIFLGVITVNPHYFAHAGPFSKPAWFLLVMLCAVAIWNVCPSNASPAFRKARRAIQVAAGLLLVVLLWLFRGKTDDGQTAWLQHAYWGMLGMIGWAYLTSSVCWLIFRRSSTALMGVMWFMIILFIGNRHGALDWLGKPVHEFANLGFIFGTNPATVMMGVLVGNALQGAPGAGENSRRLRFMFLFGLGLYLAGCLIRPLHGINKSAHTDAYALVTGGISCLLFALVYWAVDVKRWRCWNTFLVPVGQNALLAYVLPGMLTNAFAVVGLSVYWSKADLPGVLSAAVLTVVLLAMVWGLTRLRFILKL